MQQAGIAIYFYFLLIIDDLPYNNDWQQPINYNILKNIMNKLIIGIDGGGTKTHAIIVDSTKTIIDECCCGPANIRTNLSLAVASINSAIEQLVTKHDLDPNTTEIGIGVAGYSVTANREQLYTSLTQHYSKIKLHSDCHIACLAAHDGHDGTIVICGTGVVGCSLINNVLHQTGGWGFPHGDLGGGAWLGLEICKLTCKAIDKVIKWSPLLSAVFNQFEQNPTGFKTWLVNATPHEFATIAKLLIKYENKDQNADIILNKAIEEITLFMQAIVHQVPHLPIKITGGLAKVYLPILKNNFPKLEVTEHPAAYGACLLWC